MNARLVKPALVQVSFKKALVQVLFKKALVQVLFKKALVQVSLHQFHQSQKPKYYPVNIR